MYVSDNRLSNVLLEVNIKCFEQLVMSSLFSNSIFCPKAHGFVLILQYAPTRLEVCCFITIAFVWNYLLFYLSLNFAEVFLQHKAAGCW